MNIGLIVNAKGRVCLVHDEPFSATPLWVGYHVDKRMIEIIFDNGSTYPIDWTATEEMHPYLVRSEKILMIRLEDQQPVEGYDTSLLMLKDGKLLDAPEKQALEQALLTQESSDTSEEQERQEHDSEDNGKTFADVSEPFGKGGDGQRNIGLIVNARGRVCMVYDVPFEASPLWVGYHLDWRQLEIVFDNGTTYLIEWNATQEMHTYLIRTNQILLIRMVDRKPVEGLDCSFLLLRNGRFVEDILSTDDETFYINSLGQLVLSLGKARHEQAPDRARLHAFTASLSLQWSDADEQHRIRVNDAWLKKLIAATSIRVQAVHDDTAEAPGDSFDVSLPLELDFSLTAEDTQEESPTGQALH